MTSPDSQTLSDLFDQAGIKDYVGWAKEIKVHPNGNPHNKVRPYQIADLNFLAANLPRAATFSDPGLGKSLVLQALALWLTGLGNKAVIIMLPSLVRQFHKSLLATFPGCDRHITSAVIADDIKVRQKQFDTWYEHGWPDILITSYGLFRGRPKTLKDKAKVEQVTWRPGKLIDRYNFRGEALKSVGYSLLIADEAHELKNHKSKIHQEVDLFVQAWSEEQSNGLILSTGSPIETTVEDAYGLIKLLTPSRYGNKRVFDAMHCLLNPRVPYRQVLNYINLDHLYQSLYLKGRRTTKREAFPDMPARQVTEISIDLGPSHRTLYQRLIKDQVLMLPDDKVIDATQVQRLYQFSQQILLNPEKFAGEFKQENTILTALDELIESIGNRKMIIFAWFRESIELLSEYYKDFNPAVINGEVTGAAREKQKMKFIEDPTCRLLIGNVNSCGIGLDGFQHVCSYVTFAEVYSSPGGFEQAVGRVERSGQTETINIYLLVPTRTIAVKLRDNLLRKEQDMNAVVRDKKALIADLLGDNNDDGDFYDIEDREEDNELCSEAA